MSILHATEWEYMDIEWYGVDRQGQIAVFCSGGVGNLPSFVSENLERTNTLIEFFAALEKTTSSILICKQTPSEEQCARNFSDRGLYYFDANSDIQQDISYPDYIKQSSPTSTLRYEQLPANIQEALKHNFMDIENFALIQSVHIS